MNDEIENAPMIDTIVLWSSVTGHYVTETIDRVVRIRNITPEEVR